MKKKKKKKKKKMKKKKKKMQIPPRFNPYGILHTRQMPLPLDHDGSKSTYGTTVKNREKVGDRYTAQISIKLWLDLFHIFLFSTKKSPPLPPNPGSK